MSCFISYDLLQLLLGIANNSLLLLFTFATLKRSVPCYLIILLTCLVLLFFGYSFYMGVVTCLTASVLRAGMLNNNILYVIIGAAIHISF